MRPQRRYFGTPFICFPFLLAYAIRTLTMFYTRFTLSLRQHEMRIRVRKVHSSRLKPVTDDLRDIREMRKTCEMWKNCEKKGCAQDNVKSNYILFAIRLFFCTIILSLIAWENLFVSCIITAFTARWFKMRDARNLSHEVAKKVQNNPYTCVASCIFFVSHRCLAHCL